MQIRSEKGFTLTELIVTMVIIAAMAAVGIPLFFNVQTFHDRGFHNTVLSAVRYAQKHAVATGCPVRVQTTPRYNAFWLPRSYGLVSPRRPY